MRRRGMDMVLLGTGAVVAVLLVTDLWPGVRGPDNWRWERRPLEAFPPLLAVVAVFLAMAFVAARIRKVWGAATIAERSGLLGAAVLLLFAQMVLLTAAEPGGLSNVARRVESPSFTSYYTVARQVDDPGAFLRDYHRLQKSFPVHGPSQPPGRVLYFWFVDRLFGERAGPAVAGFLLMGFGALSIVPLVVLVGGRCAPGAVGGAVLLMGCLPSFLLFTPETDHLLLLVTLTAAAAKAEAMRYASRPRAIALIFAAGVAGGLGIFLSFTAIAALAAWGLALLGMVALGVVRGAPLPRPVRSAGLAGAGLAGLLVVPGLAATLGLDWPAVFRECLAAAHRVQVLVQGRQYSTWVVWNLWDFALFLGPGLAIAALVRIPAEGRAFRPGPGEPAAALEMPFAVPLGIALIALDVSGRILGETGRIWMFLMPLAVAAAVSGREGRPARDLAPLAGAQLLVLLALRAFVNVPG